jgi:NAD(P)-dependent dehydrogenase (short-subunit alcohol dehydrogenase family)
MTAIPYRTALIVGAGPGIGASLARGLAAAGLRVGLGARNVDKLTTLGAETGAETFAVDASKPAAVARLFEDADTRLGSPMSSSTTPVRAHMARSPNSIRKWFGRPLRYQPMAASSSSSGRHGQ